MLLGVDRDGGSHILHSLLFVPFKPYDPGQMFIGFRRELPPEVIPAITNIPVASFGERCAVSVVSQDEHRVHLEVFPPLDGR